MRDIYDLDTVRAVLKVLLKEHGLEPSAAKFTLVGIDSNHPTKLRSSIWRVAEVLEGGREEVQVRCVAAVGRAIPASVIADRKGFEESIQAQVDGPSARRCSAQANQRQGRLYRIRLGRRSYLAGQQDV